MQTQAALASRREGEFLSPRDVATFLSVSLNTVYRLIDAGRLPVHRLCRALRIRRRDLERLINRSRVAVGLKPYGRQED